jgi:hypothetical protein
MEVAEVVGLIWIPGNNQGKITSTAPNVSGFPVVLVIIDLYRDIYGKHLCGISPQSP